MKFLEKYDACAHGKEKYLDFGSTDLKEIVNYFCDNGMTNYAIWILSRKMSKKQSLKYAIYTTGLCAKIFKR